MMGPSHAMSAAAVWLSSTIAYTNITGNDIPLPVIAMSTVICAGAALWPDLDQHNSTVVKSFGIFGKGTHEVINNASMYVYNGTKTKYDSNRDNGHRTLMHTTPMALFTALIVSLGAMLGGHVDIFGKDFTWGQIFSLFVMWIFFHLALGGLFSNQIYKARKKFDYVKAQNKDNTFFGEIAKQIYIHRRAIEPYALLTFSAIITVIVGSFLPEGTNYGWLGIAVGAGMLIHCLGDLITKMGIPAVWPFKVHGKRWYDVALPSFMRLTTGGSVEKVLLTVFTLTTFTCIAYYIIQAFFTI